MPLLDDLRLDIGDDGIVASGSSSSQVASYTTTELIRHLRLDIGDDFGVISLSGTNNYVTGPASSTDNGVARFVGTNGGQLDGSLVTIDDNGNITTPGDINIGDAAYFAGAQYWNVRTITAAGPVTVNSTDNVVMINKTIGEPTTVTLPVDVNSGAGNRILIIKDLKGDANVNMITISPASGTIDGISSVYITERYQSFTFIRNATGYSII